MISHNNIPPKLANRFLRWFLRDDLAEEVQGDLEEQFYDNLERVSPIKAKIKYWFQVFNYLRPFAIRNVRSTYSNINIIDMFKHNFTISLRNLRKQKLYSIINFGGLAFGLACFILILLYVQHELSYDQFHENADRTYRIVQQRPTSTGFDYWAVTSPAMAGTLMLEFPEVELATTIGAINNPLLSKEEQQYTDEGILADQNFFNIFSFQLLRGDKNRVLAEINSIVLTESLAKKIFGDEDPMGQLLTYKNELPLPESVAKKILNEKELMIYKNDLPLKVTGIISDVPKTSKRTKEICVRKVLGASGSNIVSLLSGEYLLLVLIAFIVASPIAWFVMKNWLQNFAYHIDLNWWIFALSGILAIGISMFIVGLQAYKATLTNPANSLRVD